jgi:hypothetical protein
MSLLAFAGAFIPFNYFVFILPFAFRRSVGLDGQLVTRSVDIICDANIDGGQRAKGYDVLSFNGDRMFIEKSSRFSESLIFYSTFSLTKL